MIRLPMIAKAAGALALGSALGLGASTAQAQVAARGPVAVTPARAYYGAMTPGSYAQFYGPGYYSFTPANPNGYTPPGQRGPGAIRDWSSGRPHRMAKPWMAPLPR